MGKIDRSVEINIGGEKRRLKFTINAIEQVELITGKSAFALALEPPKDLTVTELIDLVQIGLQHEESNLARSVVAGWVEDFMNENPLFTLNVLVVGALGLSGLAGDVTVFTKMINRLQGNKKNNNDKASGEVGK